MEGELGDVRKYIPALLPMRYINMGLQLFFSALGV
nr:MAG TPA: hypothetical protein [Caudoviricetes sp.]